MSFFDDIGLGDVSGLWDAAKGFAGDHPIATGIASAALTGLALNAVMKSTEQPSSAPATPDYGNLLQIPASQENRIPVLYGRATFAGYITEAVQSNNGTTMTYVITLSEKTGTSIDGAPSTYTFENIYWDGKRITFGSDGVTAINTMDNNGAIDPNINGLVKVWLYAGGSNSAYQVAPDGYQVTASNAWANVPNWDSNHTMNDLIFAVVQVNYNKAHGVTGLPNMTFTTVNSLSQPGDVIFDYMTNTRYGAGIALGNIYTQ